MISAQDLPALAANPLFRAVDPAALRETLSRWPFTVSHVPARKVLFLRGDAYEDLYVLLEGRVAAEMPGPGGKNLLVEQIAAPEAIATAILFSPRRRLPVQVTALTPLKVIKLPRATLMALCQAFTPVLERLLADMGGRVAFLAEKVRMTQFGSLRHKLSVHLTELAAQQGAAGQPASEVTCPHPKNRLSEIFGVARTSLLRVWQEFETQGVIASSGRRVRLLKPAQLRAWAAEEEGTCAD